MRLDAYTFLYFPVNFVDFWVCFSFWVVYIAKDLDTHANITLE